MLIESEQNFSCLFLVFVSCCVCIWFRRQSWATLSICCQWNELATVALMYGNTLVWYLVRLRICMYYTMIVFRTNISVIFFKKNMLPYSSMWSGKICLCRLCSNSWVCIICSVDALTRNSIFFILNSFLLMNCRSAAWSHSSYSRDVSKLV